jgi:insertion element IS1 protein InsB
MIDLTLSKAREICIKIAQRLENKADQDLRYKGMVTKSETSLVGLKNLIIRHYLARFNGKTKPYRKAFDMIFWSLLILFTKSLLLSIFI